MFLLTLFVFWAFSLRSEDQNLLVGKMQMSLDKNQNESVEEIWDENEDVLLKNQDAMEKLALSFERREKYLEALKIYKKLVSEFYSKEHSKIVNFYQVKEFDKSPYMKTQLPYYYYKIAFLNVQIFKKTDSYTPKAERQKLLTVAETSIRFAEVISENANDGTLLKELLKEKNQFDESLVFEKSWYTTLSIVSWQDHLYLYENRTSKTPILSTNLGACAGGGRKWENMKYEFHIDGCFFQGKSTASSIAPNSDYEGQSNVPINAVFLGPGVYFKSLSDHIKIGLQSTFFYRTGKWSVPASGDFIMGDKTIYGGGVSALMKVKVKRFHLITKIGKIFPNPSINWTMGISFDF